MMQYRPHAGPIAAGRNMEASQLHPASERSLCECPIERRINPSGEGDDDPMVLEPVESGLL
jgi:hypothetical protein